MSRLLEVYGYEYRGPVFSWWDLARVVEACRSGGGVVSVECCRSRMRVVCRGGFICVGGVCFEEPVLDALKRDMLYMVEGGVLVPVESRLHGYSRLRCIGDCAAPTVEINGIHMHRIEGCDPWSDAVSKVRAARVRRGHRVLDTCMGLGYTALASLEAGAGLVVTVEVSDEVLWLAERNPWSRGLGGGGVVILRGDVRRVVGLFPDGFFDRIIHDPPRFSRSTGDLYSLSLYREFFRLLRPGGVLFHYTGTPKRRRGVNLAKGVSRRLLEAGFTGVRFLRGVGGVVARKPW